MSVRRELGGVPRAWGQITALCSDLPGMGWVCPFPASFERPRVPAEGPRVCRGTFTQHMQRGLYGEISELKFYHLDRVKDVFPKLQKHTRFPCSSSTLCDYHTWCLRPAL